MNGSAAPPLLLQARTTQTCETSPNKETSPGPTASTTAALDLIADPSAVALSFCLSSLSAWPSVQSFSTRPCVCKRCVSNGSAPASHSFANPPKPSFRQAIAVLPIRPSRTRYSRSGRCHGPGYCQLHAARWQLRLALPRIALPCLAYIASKPCRRPVSIVQPNRRHRNRNPVRLQQYGKPVLIDNTHPKPKSEGGIPSHARLSLTTLDNRSLFLSYAPL